MRRTAPLLALAAAATLIAVPSASAAISPQSDPDALLTGGSTALKLSVPKSTRVKVKGTGKAAVRRSTASLPISGGLVEMPGVEGSIEHRGGALLLSVGKRKLTLTDPIIALNKAKNTRFLTAKVGKTRTEILSFGAPTQVARPGFGSVLSGLKASLTAKGASRLNKLKPGRRFKAGQRFGTAKVTMLASELTILEDKTTSSMTFDPTWLALMRAANVTQSGSGKATYNAAAGSVTLPVRGFKVRADGKDGLVTHTGGVAFTRGATRIAFDDLQVYIDPRVPRVVGTVPGFRDSSLFTFDDQATVPQVVGRRWTMANVPLRLNPDAAALFNTQFGTQLIPGTPVGVATVVVEGL